MIGYDSWRTLNNPDMYDYFLLDMPIKTKYSKAKKTITEQRENRALFE